MRSWVCVLWSATQGRKPDTPASNPATKSTRPCSTSSKASPTLSFLTDRSQWVPEKGRLGSERLPRQAKLSCLRRQCCPRQGQWPWNHVQLGDHSGAPTSTFCSFPYGQGPKPPFQWAFCWFILRSFPWSFGSTGQCQQASCVTYSWDSCMFHHERLSADEAQSWTMQRHWVDLKRVAQQELTLSIFILHAVWLD